MGRHRGASGAAVFMFDDSAEAVEVHLALPYFEHGPDDGPHHVTQETVGLDLEDQQLAVIIPSRLHNLAVVGFNLSV